MLHRWAIDEREYRRHEERRGRRHAFERIDPERAALVVIDMIPFFVEANEYAVGIVPNVSRLADALRGAGGTVAWVLPGSDEPSAARLELLGPEVAERYRTSAEDGSLWPEFTIDSHDIVVEKSAASAFFPGSCPLAERLTERGIEAVLIAGTVANVCCESSARDASTLGYRTIMIADANAARTDRDLNATLHTFYRSFGDVRPTDEILGLVAAA